MMEQLELFTKPASELDALWLAITELKHSHNKVRKRLFREIKDLEEELIKVKLESSRSKFQEA
jgi:hypothetical protein